MNAEECRDERDSFDYLRKEAVEPIELLMKLRAEATK